MPTSDAFHIVLEAPYPRDNQLNVFGDFDLLRMIITRAEVDCQAPRIAIELAASCVPTRKKQLNPEEEREALRTFFSRNSNRV